jgi:uroporphyrinogen decarboxylase
MNGVERIVAAVNFAPADRTPVIPQVLGHAAVLAGVPLGDYVRHGDLLARCQVAAQRHYGHDAVFAFMDANVETEAVGSVLTYHRDEYPQVASYALQPEADFRALAIPDPARAGRMPELVRAAGALRAQLGDQAMVVGVVLGPMSMALQLLGPEPALYLAADEPRRFEELLAFTTQVALAFGLAQLDAGVHLPMVFEPGASPAVVPPAFFRELVLPRLRQVFAGFKQAGALAAWLHIAGPVEPILPWYAGAGVDIANLDYVVDVTRAAQMLPRTAVNGTVKSLSFVLDAAADIAAESRRLLAAFAPRGGFILSSGCEIPPEAKPENIAALVAAAREGA